MARCSLNLAPEPDLVHHLPMEIPDTVASTDDVTLRLYDLGGTGPPLLLCHATGFCGQIWEPMVAPLRRRHHCISFDFRAHGRSTRPVGRSLVWDGMADDVLAVANAISPDRPIAAVGHSMGGTSLLMAEHRKPGTIERAWTFEPILFGDEPHVEDPNSSDISERARRRRAVFADRDEAFKRYGSRPPLSLLDERALRAYVDHGFRDLADGTVTLCCRPEDEAAIFEFHNSGARRIVGSIAMPFVVVASGDGQAPALAVIDAAAEFQNLNLWRYENLTHFGPLQDPDRIGADVAAWLG